ncbi:MAG: restriction endonuclease subunit S, partial [Bacteroidaceae bacterium]|nr:restriction endonuclease subunit S [Bacteroidaceae bacterium]
MTKVCQKVFHDFLAYFFTIFEVFEQVSLNVSLVYCASDTPHYENVPFEVPDGWKWCNITDVTSKITDGTHHSPENGLKGDYKYVTAKNIKSSGIVLDNITYVNKEVHDEIYSRCNPEKGDILYIKDGATTGIVAINNLEEPFSLLSSVALIKPLGGISNEYLLYYLQSSLCYNSVRESMKGVGITRITLKQIEKWDIPLPPQAEQHRIVAEIERWFTLINQIEQGKVDLQATIKQAKSKILNLAIHGKLVPQNSNDEPASELLKRINPKAKITCDNGLYGKVPNGW